MNRLFLPRSELSACSGFLVTSRGINWGLSYLCIFVLMLFAKNLKHGFVIHADLKYQEISVIYVEAGKHQMNGFV